MSGHTIECPCGTVLRGDDEVLAAAAACHAADAHGMFEVPDEVVAAIRSSITDAA